MKDTINNNGPRLISAKGKILASPSEHPQRIAVLGLPKSALSDFAGPYEAFLMAGQLAGHDSSRSHPCYEVSLLSTDSDSIPTLSGLSVTGARPYLQYNGYPDTLIVAGEVDSLDLTVDQSPLMDWLRQAAAASRRVCSVCTGVFCLAQAGVLDGRRITTHWKYAETLAQSYPKVQVDPEPVFLRDGKFYTSAGCTAAMDLALALIEDDLGSALALEIARTMVMYVRRPAGQSQISSILKLQMSDREPMRELQAWILEHLQLPLTVEDLASQVHMSPRNFARSFVAKVGMTPARFLESLRLEAARRRLEETDRSHDQIAAECGFGSAETMRRSFVRHLGILPTAYRSRVLSA